MSTSHVDVVHLGDAGETERVRILTQRNREKVQVDKVPGGLFHKLWKCLKNKLVSSEKRHRSLLHTIVTQIDWSTRIELK